MPSFALGRHFFPFGGQKEGAVRFGIDQRLFLQSQDDFMRGDGAHPEPFGNFGHAGFALFFQKIENHLHIVLGGLLGVGMAQFDKLKRLDSHGVFVYTGSSFSQG